ncbi:hypothetical protein Q7P37_008902 [Cladosporium fusiforme]
MPFGRLSPVSETDSESLSSVRTRSIDLRPRPLNFSRPKPQDLPSSRNIHHDAQYANSTSSSSSNAGGSTRGIGAAFYETPPSSNDLPDEPRFDDEPRFSLESDRSANSSSLHSELIWDPHAGELRSRSHLTRRGSDFDAQRSEAPRRPPNNRTTTSSRTATDPSQPLIAELPGDRPPSNTSTTTVQQKPQAPQPPNPFSQIHVHAPTHQLQNHHSSDHILKRTSLDQQSERLSISSIHTISPSATTTRKGSAGTVGWEDPSNRSPSDEQQRTGAESRTSNFDVSQLGEKKLAKLKKKGINPELYLEMKAARGGKSKLVGPLVGNTYIG